MKDGFQLRQLHGSLQDTSCCNVHWLRFITSGASYIRTTPSAEHVARRSPKDFGANFTSVTEVRESTRLVLRTQCLVPRSPGTEPSPTTMKRCDSSTQQVLLWWRQFQHVLINIFRWCTARPGSELGLYLIFNEVKRVKLQEEKNYSKLLANAGFLCNNACTTSAELKDNIKIQCAYTTYQRLSSGYAAVTYICCQKFTAYGQRATLLNAQCYCIKVSILIYKYSCIFKFFFKFIMHISVNLRTDFSDVRTKWQNCQNFNKLYASQWMCCSKKVHYHTFSILVL